MEMVETGSVLPRAKNLGAVIGLDGLEQVGLAALAAGDQGGNIVGQLQRGIELVGLAVCGPGGQILAGAFSGRVPALSPISIPVDSPRPKAVRYSRRVSMPRR